MKPRLHIVCACIAYAVLVTCDSHAAVEECKNVTILLSGNLSLETVSGQGIDDEIAESASISIPLEAIGGEDAEVIARLRRTTERNWIIDVQSRVKGEDEEGASFQQMLGIDFADNGRQRFDQFMTVHTKSRHEHASRELITIRADGFVMSGAATQLSALELNRSPGACPRLGEVDVANEVNGGKPSVVRFYDSPEEAQAAMLADWYAGKAKEDQELQEK